MIPDDPGARLNHASKPFFLRPRIGQFRLAWLNGFSWGVALCAVIFLIILAAHMAAGTIKP